MLREALSSVSIKSHPSETEGAPQSSLQGCAWAGLVLVQF